RIWIRRHAYGTSDWRGLVAALEDAAGIPLHRWARAWILRPGVPRLHARVDADAGAGTCVRIVQRPAGATRGAPWPLRFRVDVLHARGARESHIVQLDARHTELRLPYRAGALPRIVLDAGDDAYALVALDPAQIASAGPALGRTRCALQRMQLWEQVWQSVRECRSDPAGFVMLALQALARERSELIVAAVLQR